LILLVRPSNIIFLPVVLFLGVTSWKELSERVKYLIKPLNLTAFLLIIFLVFLPQMIYWRFLSGSFIFNTYQGEGFTNWAHPQLAKILLSPANGLLTYSPAYFLILPGVTLMFVRKEADRWLVPFVFLLLLYMTSSWYAYRFGCSFGQRSYVEYLALFSLPVASLIKWCFKTFFPFLSVTILIFIVYFIYMNIAITGIYEKCHNGGDWEWAPYKMYFKKARVIPFHSRKQVFTWFDDFESDDKAFSSRFHVYPSDIAFSGDFVSRVDTLARYSDGFGGWLGQVVLGRIWKVDVSLRCYYPGIPEKTLIVCSVDHNGEMLSYQTYRPDDQSDIRQGTWNHIETSFEMNGIPPFGYLKVYAWMVDGEEILIDDMQVTIHSEKKIWKN
jgi:hypothetical protein